MEWWLWLAGGLALVVAEVVTPSGFFIIFFGLAALTVGVLVWLQVVGSLAFELLIFTVLSVAYLLVFRGRLQSSVPMPPSSNVDSLIGVLAVVQERLSPGVVGRVEVRAVAPAPAPEPRRAPARPAAPALDDYLTNLGGH